MKPSAAATQMFLGAELAVTKGPDAGRRAPISNTAFTIGRAEDCDLVLTPFGYDHVCKRLGGFDEGHVHGPDGVAVLRADLCERSPTRFDVAADAAHQAEVGGGIDEEFDIESLANARFGEHQDAFDDDDGRGLDADGIRFATVTTNKT